MRCFILSDDRAWVTLFSDASQITPIHADPREIEPTEEDILFDLREEAWDMDLYQKFYSPVFLSAVIGTLAEHSAPPHLVRINGWDGMLAKPAIEASGRKEIKEKASEIMAMIGKKVEWVEDVPGMVSARVLAMIINEASMAEQEAVSDVSSIDIAMKLGTNYPYGPFEWGARIGMHKIETLLQKLSLTDVRYHSQIKPTIRP